MGRALPSSSVHWTLEKLQGLEMVWKQGRQALQYLGNSLLEANSGNLSYSQSDKTKAQSEKVRK